MDWLRRKLLENNQKIYTIQQENETLDIHVEQKQTELDHLMIEISQRQMEIEKLRQRFEDNKILLENLRKVNHKINNKIRNTGQQAWGAEIAISEGHRNAWGARIATSMTRYIILEQDNLKDKARNENEEYPKKFK